MALANTTDWECRTAGSDLNGGGFNRAAAGTDFSQQNAAQDNGTNLTVDAVTNTDVTPDGYTVGSADVGNIINITSGAPWTPGRYQINSIQGGTKWRLDRSPAAVGSTTGTWYLGGAIASPSLAVALGVTNHKIYIKNDGVYSITSTSPNTSGGILQTAAGGGGSTGNFIIGYKTTRNEVMVEADMPVLQASGISTVAIIDINHTMWKVQNIKIDGATLSSITGIDTTINYTTVYNCVVINCTLYGIYLSGNGDYVIYCRVYGCSGTAGIYCFYVQYCEVFDNTCNGISCHAAFYNLTYRNRGASIYGIYFGSSTIAVAIGNVCFYNQSHGIHVVGQLTGINNILYNNGGYGINLASYSAALLNNAYGLNSSGETNNAASIRQNEVTLSADPFTNAATGTGGASDFSLNSTAGGGAACKNVGFPTESLASTDTFNDIGYSRHQDPAGAGGGLLIHPGMTGGING